MTTPKSDCSSEASAPSQQGILPPSLGNIAQFRKQVLQELTTIARAMNAVEQDAIVRLQTMEQLPVTTNSTASLGTESPAMPAAASVPRSAPVAPVAVATLQAERPSAITPAPVVASHQTTHDPAAATSNLDDSQDRLANLKRQLAAKLSGQAVANSAGKST